MLLFMSFKTNQIETIRILLCAINDLCKPPAFFNFMLSCICYWKIDMKTPYEMASLSTIEGAGCEATFFRTRCVVKSYCMRTAYVLGAKWSSLLLFSSGSDNWLIGSSYLWLLMSQVNDGYRLSKASKVKRRYSTLFLIRHH